jgi:hypothetical protein
VVLPSGLAGGSGRPSWPVAPDGGKSVSAPKVRVNKMLRVFLMMQLLLEVRSSVEVAYGGDQLKLPVPSHAREIDLVM